MKWAVVVVVGWYWVGSWMGSIVVAIARDIGEEREFDKSRGVREREREKMNKLLLYTTIVTV